MTTDLFLSADTPALQALSLNLQSSDSVSPVLLQLVNKLCLLIEQERYFFGSSDINSTVTVSPCDGSCNTTSSVALYSSRYEVFIKRPEGGLNIYTAPFHRTLWVATVAMLVVFSLVLWLLWLSVKKLISSAHEEEHTFTLYNSVFSVCAAFTQQGTELLANSCSLRVAVLTVHLTAVLVLTAYTARLVAELTVPKMAFPFEDIPGLLQDGSYEIGFATSYLGHTFQETLGVLQSAVTTNMTSPEEGLGEVCSSNFALLLRRDDALQLASRLPCNIAPLPSASLPVDTRLEMSGDRLHVLHVRYSITRLRQLGLLQRVLLETRPGAMPPVHRPPLVMSLDNIKPALGLMLLAFVVSTLFLAVELLAAFISAKLGFTSNK